MLRPIGDILSEVVRQCATHPDMGPAFVLFAIDRMRPADQKAAIMFSRDPEIGLISDHQAEILIRELGLKHE